MENGTIWTIEDVTASKEHRKRLTCASTHDALTGLVATCTWARAMTQNGHFPTDGQGSGCANGFGLTHRLSYQGGLVNNAANMNQKGQLWLRILPTLST